jgi:hypothetical protein
LKLTDDSDSYALVGDAGAVVDAEAFVAAAKAAKVQNEKDKKRRRADQQKVRRAAAKKLKLDNEAAARALV